MKSSFIGVSVLASTLLFIGGCGVPAAPADLISPPSADTSNRNDAARRDLIKLLPEQAKILSPKQDKERDNIAFGDIDGDGTDEAVVVFQMNQGSGKILKAALFKQHQREWRIVSEVEGFGYGVNVAEFKDYNHDGRPELALGWSLGGAGNGLDIYEWQKDKLVLLSKKVYPGRRELE